MYQTHNSQPELFDFNARALNAEWVNWYMRSMNCNEEVAVKAGVSQVLSQVRSMTDFAHSWVSSSNLNPLGFVSLARHGGMGGGMRGGFMNGMYADPSFLYGSSRPVNAFTGGGFQGSSGLSNYHSFPGLDYVTHPNEPSPFYNVVSPDGVKGNRWIEWFKKQGNNVNEEYAIQAYQHLVANILKWNNETDGALITKSGTYAQIAIGTQEGHLSLAWVLQQAALAEKPLSLANIQEEGERLLPSWLEAVSKGQATFFGGGSVYTQQYAQQGRYPADINEPSLFYKDSSENPQTTNDPWVRWRAQELGYRPNGNFNKGLMDEVKTNVLDRVKGQSRIVVTCTEKGWSNNVQPQLRTPAGYLSLIWVIWMGDQNLNMSWEEIHEEGMKQIKASNLNEGNVPGSMGNPGYLG